MPKMTGAKFIAETVHGYGITHVFFMPYIGPRALMEMETLGIKRVQTHGEKAAAYMADAYARVNRSPSLCMAQSVGGREPRRGVTRRLSCLRTGDCNYRQGKPNQPTTACVSRGRPR